MKKILNKLYPQHIKDFNKTLYKDVNKKEVRAGIITIVIIGIVSVLLSLTF